MSEESGVPFNSYGQILSMGAERYAAYLLSQGIDSGEISARLHAKFGPVTNQTVNDVLRFSGNMFEAATQLQNTRLEDYYDLSLIPQNPSLFGGDPASGRGIIAGALTTAQGGQPRFFNYIFPVQVTPLDIFTQFQVKLPQWVELYPGRFNEYAAEHGEDFSFLLLYTERMY